MVDNDDIQVPMPQLDEIKEALKDLPDDKRKIIERHISFFMQGIGPMTNPLHEKITEDHISSIIANSEKESVRHYSQQKMRHVINFVIFLVAVSVFAILLIIFRNHMSDIRDLLTHLVALAAGAYGGYGYGMSKYSKE